LRRARVARPICRRSELTGGSRSALTGGDAIVAIALVGLASVGRAKRSSADPLSGACTTPTPVMGRRCPVRSNRGSLPRTRRSRARPASRQGASACGLERKSALHAGARRATRFQRDTGNFTVRLANTTWHLTDVSFENPDTTSQAHGGWLLPSHWRPPLSTTWRPPRRTPTRASGQAAASTKRYVAVPSPRHVRPPRISAISRRP
jgi:hypothetical protein